MDVHVSLEGRGDLSARIYRQLLDAVLDGRLRPGERLPPTRELATRLAVSRNTVAVAYERLAAEGLLTGHVGAGTFVSTDALARVQTRRAPTGADVQPRRIWRELAAASSGWRAEPRGPTVPSQPPSPLYDFGVGVPDARLFPLAMWRRLVARELRPAAMRSSKYGDPAGHPGLRAAIARHVGLSRAVRASADDVIVTQGAQQAIDLIGRVLIEPGECVAVEEPGYPPVRQLFHSLGATVVGVPVDDEGLDVAAIPSAARLIYVTPSHQFPWGVPMTMRRRVALLTWAERRRALIVEDDYDSEFRFVGRPLDPLQSIDRTGRVLYVGSFSKVMLPGLRLGFLVAPASLQDALRTAKRLSDWHGEMPTQAALARFIDEGLLARHIRKVGREYAARRARIIETLERDFAAWVRVVPSAAGLHLAARVVARGPRVDIDEIRRRARATGVAVDSVSRFAVERTATSSPAGLVIGYGAIATAKIDEGLKRLAAAFTSDARSAARPPARSRRRRSATA